MKPSLRLLLPLLCLAAVNAAGAAGELSRREWIVDGVPRVGLVHTPAGRAAGPVPVVFVFHGHGGSMRQVARAAPVHELWPDALVVYLQGLPTPGRLTDPKGERSGWQAGPGDQHDRDLKFFDTVLQDLRRQHAVDAKRIYATGHSNGGSFTYLLWATRREVFAAFGPSGSLASHDYPPLQPAPVIHIAGEKDELVRFAWQQQMIQQLLRTNECGPGQPAGEGVTLYPSKIGAPVKTYLTAGGHQYPTSATRLIVEFFQQQRRP
ncbi:MAG: hypothetical protein Q8J74_02705 [Candidatus Didemnitutus sp.]|nr:hypothetical protein [Candidatus Didemnitutus sp.]